MWAASTLSCTTPALPVDISDIELTVIKGSPLQTSTFPEYAVQEHFLSMGQADLDKDQTDQYVDSLYLAGDPAVIMPLSSFTNLNAEIAKVCSNTPCNYEAVQALQAAVDKLKAAASQ